MATILITILLIVAFVASINGSFRLLDWMNQNLTRKDTSIWLVLLLLVPWILLALWCVVLNIVVFLFALLTGHEVARLGRDWWHRGGK